MANPVKVCVHHQDGSIMTLVGLHGLTAFFQAWTFFRLLRAFFQTQPPLVDIKGYFLVQKEIGCFVTTRSILRCLAFCRFNYKCFGTASDLSCVVNHLNRFVDAQHLGRYPVACLACGAVFKRRDNLDYHWKTVHGGNDSLLAARGGLD